MGVASRGFVGLVLAVGAAAVVIGIAFVVRAALGEDPLASWYSAVVGVAGGGCCVVWAARRLARARR